MKHDDPIYLAKYASDHDLLDNPGWKELHRYVTNTKNMNCILKYAKAKHNHNTVNIKFGMQITCDYKETMMSDADNGNTNWKGAELIELNQIYNFDPLDSLGPSTSACIQPGHTNTQVHFIYDYKKYGGYKSRMVTSSNITGPKLETY